MLFAVRRPQFRAHGGFDKPTGQMPPQDTCLSERCHLPIRASKTSFFALETISEHVPCDFYAYSLILPSRQHRKLASVIILALPVRKPAVRKLSDSLWSQKLKGYFGAAVAVQEESKSRRGQGAQSGPASGITAALLTTRAYSLFD